MIERITCNENSPHLGPRGTDLPQVLAIVHDYLTQCGGAERVVLAMATAFPGAPIYTSLYEPALTFPDFGDLAVRTGPLQRLGLLRRHHRLALPLLAPAFSSLRITAPLVLCSSSGWGHGVRTKGRKVVYCHSPARWLYDPAAYVSGWNSPVASAALGILRPPLRMWDRRAAASASRYLANSTAVRNRLWAVYGIDAEVLPPPPSLDPSGHQEPVPGLEAGFLLCVSRLLGYKNVGAIIEAVSRMPQARLVVLGSGPDESRLREQAGDRIWLLGRVADSVLRWCYANCAALVAASNEDFGLTPLEANCFGKPAVVLRAGGFLDTVVDGVNGTFFRSASPDAIREALRRSALDNWSSDAIRAHAEQFSEAHFKERLVEVVSEEVQRA